VSHSPGWVAERVAGGRRPPPGRCAPGSWSCRTRRGSRAAGSTRGDW
jgi:hypothetical protein